MVGHRTRVTTSGQFTSRQLAAHVLRPNQTDVENVLELDQLVGQSRTAAGVD
jgi:hypothetical protein